MKNKIGNFLYISSLNNSQIKSIKKLFKKKFRKIENKFLAEGELFIREAVHNNWTITDILCDEKKIDQIQKTDVFQKLLDKNTKIKLVKKKIIQKILETDNSQDFLFVVEKKKFNIELIKNMKFCLALERIRNPRNLGTIFRTMESVGIKMCFLIDECVDPYSFEVVKGSMGALFNIKFVNVTREKFLKITSENKINLFGSSSILGMEYDKFIWKFPFVLIMGNEKDGISESLKKNCKNFIKIPMKGRIQSLNLSNATSILLHDIIRKNPI